MERLNIQKYKWTLLGGIVFLLTVAGLCMAAPERHSTTLENRIKFRRQTGISWYEATFDEQQEFLGEQREAEAQNNIERKKKKRENRIRELQRRKERIKHLKDKAKKRQAALKAAADKRKILRQKRIEDRKKLMEMKRRFRQHRRR